MNQPTGSWGLAAAMREQEQRALLHRLPQARALADARDQLRRCLSALRACDLPRAADATELGILVAVLVDQLEAVERLQARL